MPRASTILLALLAPVFPVIAQEAEPPAQLLFMSAEDVQLDDYLWQSRLLVIFADADADPRFAEQLELLAEDPIALADRDVVVITDTSKTAPSSVRTDLRPRGFMLALVAKDGSIVFRKPLPWDVREITRAIDKLPLRKQELSKARSLSN